MHVYVISLYFLFILRTVNSIISIHECKPYYHFWRPYYSKVPEDAFRASERSADIFIGKVIPLDDYSWTHAAPIHGYNFIPWQWPNKQAIRVDKFMEILCTEDRYKKMLQWRRVPDKTDMQIILRYCCLVESGVVRHREQDFFAYIGRKLINGTYFVGPVYLVQDWYFPTGLYSMDGWNSIFVPEDFDILHYGCSRDM